MYLNLSTSGWSSLFLQFGPFSLLKYVTGDELLSFARNFSNKYEKQLLDTGLDALETAFKTVVHKALEATDQFTGNKIADKIVKSKHVTDENPRNVEELIIPPEKREKILNESRHLLQK